jgi:hypothetical protein
MKKIFALLIAVISLSCTQAQKKEFSNEALSETLLAKDGSQVAFKDILYQIYRFNKFLCNFFVFIECDKAHSY